MAIVVLNWTFISLEYPVGLMSLSNWWFSWFQTIFTTDAGPWFLCFLSLAVQHVDHSPEGFVFRVLFYAFWGLAILNSIFADDLDCRFLDDAYIFWLEGLWLVESDHIGFPVWYYWVGRVFVDVLAIFLSGDWGLGFHFEKLLRSEGFGLVQLTFSYWEVRLIHLCLSFGEDRLVHLCLSFGNCGLVHLVLFFRKDRLTQLCFSFGNDRTWRIILNLFSWNYGLAHLTLSFWKDRVWLAHLTLSFRKDRVGLTKLTLFRRNYGIGKILLTFFLRYSRARLRGWNLLILSFGHNWWGLIDKLIWGFWADRLTLI